MKTDKKFILEYSRKRTLKAFPKKIDSEIISHSVLETADNLSYEALLMFLSEILENTGKFCTEETEYDKYYNYCEKTYRYLIQQVDDMVISNNTVCPITFNYPEKFINEQKLFDATSDIEYTEKRIVISMKE